MPSPRRHLNDRLAENDPELVRLDITASTLIDFTNFEKEDFIASLQANKTVRHVHLSGDGLETVLSAELTDLLIDALGYMENLEELFVFKGDNDEVSGVLHFGQDFARAAFWHAKRFVNFVIVPARLPFGQTVQRIRQQVQDC